jgi:hypothetical protein
MRFLRNMMANLRRIHQSITVMKRVSASRKHKFDLRSWQRPKILRVLTLRDSAMSTTENEAVSCGTSACFAGWLALSPEAQAEGLAPALRGMIGVPTYKGMTQARAFSEY